MTHCTVAGPHCTPHNTLYSTLNTAQNTARHTEATSLERTSYTGQHTSHTAQRTSYTAQRTTLAQQCCSTAMPLCSQQTQFNTNPHCGRFEVVDSTPHCLTATLVNWTPHHSAPAEDTTHTPHWALGTGYWALDTLGTGHWVLGTGQTLWSSGQLDTTVRRGSTSATTCTSSCRSLCRIPPQVMHGIESSVRPNRRLGTQSASAIFCSCFYAPGIESTKVGSGNVNYAQQTASQPPMAFRLAWLRRSFF